MIKIFIVAIIFSLLILYFMFGHINDKTRRRVYYLPLCIVSTGFLFVTLHSPSAVAGKPPSCNEIDVTDMVSKHIDNVNFIPNSLKFSEATEYTSDGKRQCKLMVSVHVKGEPVERLLITYHYSIDKNEEGTYLPTMTFVDVKAYRLSH